MLNLDSSDAENALAEASAAAYANPYHVPPERFVEAHPCVFVFARLAAQRSL